MRARKNINILKTGRNDPCPCGSKKKFKKCCGGDAGATAAAEVPKPSYPVRTDPDLLSLGYRVLDTFESVAMSVVPSATDVPLRLRQVCAYYHAAKIHGATLAAMALLERGYAREAFPYERHVYEYFTSAHYFERFPDEAERFVASGPVLYKRMRDRWLSLDPTALAAHPELDVAAADAQARFPTLQRPKGKSAASKSPVMIDWAPPEPLEMSIRLYTHDMKNDPADVETARARYGLPATAAVEEIAERFARERHFVVSENPSHFMHGTVFGLTSMLDSRVATQFPKFNMDFDEENALLCGFLDLCLAVGYLVGRVSGVDIASLDPLRTEFAAMQIRFVSGSG
jgi:hypothetical protein